jgi:hypothetical protein
MSTALTIPAQQSIVERIEALYNTDAVTVATAIAQSIDTYQLATDDDEKVLIDGLKVVSVALKQTEADLKEALVPVGTLETWIRAGYAKLSDPYKKAIASGKQRVMDYRNAKARRESAARVEAARLARIAAEEAKERAPVALAPPPAAVAVVPVANMTKGGIGSAAGTKRMHVRMVDIYQVATGMPHLLELKGADDAGWVKGPTQAAVLEVKAALMRNPQLTPTDVPGLEWRWDEGLSLR